MDMFSVIATNMLFQSAYSKKENTDKINFTARTNHIITEETHFFY